MLSLLLPSAASDIIVSNPSQGKLDELKVEFPALQITHDNQEAIIGAEFIILAVKPWLIKSVLRELKLKSKQIIISVAAGINFEELAHYVPEPEMTMFRIIPNTAISEMESMTLIASRNATKEQEQLMLDIFNQMGLAMLIPEEKFAACTSMASCGIAYVLKYIQAAMQAGIEMVYFADPRSTVAKLALRDESDTYIRENVFDNIIFYPENFSFVSEKSGYNHLYWYSIGGNLLKQVTAGQYEVQEFLGYDPEEGSFYFSSNEESPMRSAIYKIDRKGKKTRLSSQAGTNSAQFSANMKYYMNRYSNLDTPTVITLNDNTGKTLATLMDNAALKQEISGYDMPRKEFFTFQTSDGTTLNGWMMKPADFSAGKKYPVLMYQYSGPGSQQVLDKFSVSWETYMASQGYIVVCVDAPFMSSP